MHTWRCQNRVFRRLLTTRPTRVDVGGGSGAGALLATTNRDIQAKRNIVFKMMNPPPHKITGYIVTFPSIPDETVENNELLANIARSADWPPLARASPKEFYEGTTRLLMEHGATVMEHLDLLETDKSLAHTTENVLDPLITEMYDVDYAFHTLMLKMLTDWPECTTAAFDTDMYHIKMMCAREHMEKLSNRAFQETLEKIYDNNEEADPWKNRLLMLHLLDIKAHGFDQHDPKTRSLIGSWSRFLDQYRIKYQTNIVLTSDTQVFKIPNEKALADAPLHVRRQLAATHTCYREDHENGPWIGKLEPQSIFALLRYCGARGVRHQAWTAWTSRTAFGSDHYNNSVNIEELRHNVEGLARVLGYSSPAEHRYANKMVGTTQTVRRFLAALTRRMRPAFMERMNLLERFAVANDSITTGLDAYDMYYISRREAESHCNISALELRKHFPFWQTFDNLVELLTHLFNLKFEVIIGARIRSDVVSTHLQDLSNTGLERCDPNARIYAVRDATSGDHLGRVYIDPFCRSSKRGGWNTLLGRPANEARGLDKIVYVIGDADAPTMLDGHQDGVSLLHYSQLKDMLFQIGRAVQLLCSRSPYREVTIPQAPMYSADWDAADFFPTFVRFFAYKPSLLAALSCPHVETGEQLSEEEVNLIALALARSTLWESYRTLFWADFDLTLYEMEDRKQGFWLDIYRRMYKEYFPFALERNNYQPCSMIPLFGMPSHAATYYRKLWTEMLALDVHDTFNTEQDERSTGERLKSTLLNNGALEFQGELYRRFQGRDPSVGGICDFYDPPATEHLEQQSEIIN